MVVFFDIDGTLVDDVTQIIPDSAVRAIGRLRENGHIPVINSGRPYTHVDPRVHSMDFRDFVCGCGMEVRHEDRWLKREHPAPEVCRIIRDAVRACGMRVMYEHRDGATLVDGKWSDHYGCRWEADRVRARGKQVLEIDSLPEPMFMKFVTLDGPDCRREDFIRLAGRYFDYSIRKNTLVEYILKGCSKARGMEILMEALGLPMEETLAIGDSTNDLPMFRAAGRCVCMGGGMQQAKDEADFVTGTVLEDGIERALKHFDLI